ncbi:MAG: sulfite exporter TauE/SafE family protein, partial [Deltaproteobacteria bacterium]|nr:sulfite exporter TauE/SafE family protein [Deltaproteobacteria bacterium]
MTGIFLGAAISGAVGSPHCLGMCGGFAAAASEDPVGAVAYHVGRLCTYAFLGALAAAIGSSLPGPGWVAGVVATGLLLWFSARLAGLISEKHVPSIPGLTRASAKLLGRRDAVARWALGVLTAFLPCGLVYAALGLPMAVAEPVQGALTMVVFGLGTVPLLGGVAAGFRRFAARSLWARRALAAAVLTAGMWSINARHGWSTSD